MLFRRHTTSASLIEQVNTASAVVALDTPSGLDVTSGRVPGIVVRADATMTLALPKVGLRKSEIVGDLYLADISVPPAATSSYGPAPDFSTSPLLRITR